MAPPRLQVCRMAVGVGEASFVALAAPFIGACSSLPLQSHSSAIVGCACSADAHPCKCMAAHQCRAAHCTALYFAEQPHLPPVDLRLPVGPADDNAPPARKALWLGVFFGCIPTGGCWRLGLLAPELLANACSTHAALQPPSCTAAASMLGPCSLSSHNAPLTDMFAVCH